MADETVNLAEKTVKRFTSYEEFVKEFYPKEDEQEAQQGTDGDGDFGADLAFESMNRHAGLLRFGDAQ